MITQTLINGIMWYVPLTLFIISIPTFRYFDKKYKHIDVEFRPGGSIIILMALSGIISFLQLAYLIIRGISLWYYNLPQ